MYPKARLDALSDAIFGVAMTLPVLDVRLLDVRLPDAFGPHDAAAIGRCPVSPRQALWAMALNITGPRISRRTGGTR